MNISRMRRDIPFSQGFHAHDLGGAEAREALHEDDADVHFDGLAARVSS